ncbi:hypothetical protein D3C80_1292130 [compost metagenome]
MVVEPMQGDDDGPRLLIFGAPAQIGQPRPVLHHKGAAPQRSFFDARAVEAGGRRQRRLEVGRRAGGEKKQTAGQQDAPHDLSFSPCGRRWAPEALG